MEPPYPPGYQFGGIDEMLRAALVQQQAQQQAPDVIERQVAARQAAAEMQRQAVLASLGGLGGLGGVGLAPPVNQPIYQRRPVAGIRRPPGNLQRLRAIMAALAGNAGGWSQVHPDPRAGYRQVHPDPRAGFRQVHPAAGAGYVQVHPHSPWAIVR